MADHQPVGYKTWSTERLVRAATVEREDYVPEALRLIDDELEHRQVPLAERQRVEDKISVQVASEATRLTGVRGWLLFFVVLVLLNSVGIVLAALAQLMEEPSLLGAGLLVPAWAWGFWGFWVFTLLVRRRGNAPRQASRWLISGFVMSVAYAVGLFLLTHQIIGAPFGAVFMAIWLTYLEKSRRVALTYASTS